MIIDKISGKKDDMDLSGKRIHIVEFTEEQMAKSHQRFQTQDGIEAAVSFDAGVCMEDGDILCIGDRDCILIQAAEEEVFSIRPNGNRSWGKTCYNIGNMHKKAYFCGEEILVPYDTVLEQVLLKLDVRYRREKRRIIGERANISAVGHI